MTAGPTTTTETTTTTTETGPEIPGSPAPTERSSTDGC